MKSKLIKLYGGSELELAHFLSMTRQRVNAWPEELNKQQRDGVIAALVRKDLPPPKWLLK